MMTQHVRLRALPQNILSVTFKSLYTNPPNNKKKKLFNTSHLKSACDSGIYCNLVWLEINDVGYGVSSVS